MKKIKKKNKTLVIKGTFLDVIKAAVNVDKQRVKIRNVNT